VVHTTGVDGPTTTAPIGSSVWAASEAERLLRDLPRKWAHTREVARHAGWAAAGVPPGRRDLLVAAAYLHDIGYADDIAGTGFHPLDGARHLRDLGLFDLACLVAHHSGAAVEAAHRGLGAELAEFPRPVDAVADAVTYADVTSGPTGDAVEPGDRLSEILQRHGPDSIVAASRSEARPLLYAAVARTLRRATAARPLPAPLLMTPVQLGCTVLLRFHGTLDADTTGHAVRSLQDALSSDTHAVVCDLALVSHLAPAAARALAAVVTDGRHLEADPVVTLLDVPSAHQHTLRAAFPGHQKPPLVSGIENALVPHCT
jgi:anti-anti-sigma regulatory factor